MGKFYIINAPFGFSTVWSLIKGWLDPVTVSKIHILGSSYQSDLLKQIPAESLPKSLGGDCVCEEGCSLSDAGPWKGRKKSTLAGSVKDKKEEVVDAEEEQKKLSEGLGKEEGADAVEGIENGVAKITVA